MSNNIPFLTTYSDTHFASLVELFPTAPQAIITAALKQSKGDLNVAIEWLLQQNQAVSYNFINVLQISYIFPVLISLGTVKAINHRWLI